MPKQIAKIAVNWRLLVAVLVTTQSTVFFFPVNILFLVGHLFQAYSSPIEFL
jgi:hypothetical protein